MKEVIFIIHSLCGGGAERVIANLSRELQRKKIYKTYVVIFDETVEYSLEKDTDLLIIRNKSNNRLARDIIRLSDLRKVIKNHSGATLISFLPKMNIYTSVAALGCKCKVIISERNDPRNNANRIVDFLRKCVYKSVDRCVFQTEDAMSYFGDKIAQKSIIIGNPIKQGLPERYDGVRNKNIVNFCSLTPQKNLPMLISAFNIVHNIYPEYTLTIYGKGVLRTKLEEQIRKLGIQESCRIENFQDNIHEIIRKDAMYVSSSDYEGISNSMLEAMAIGIPVICTDCPCGGARKYIRDGENGLLSEVGNAKMLADKIIWMIENPEKASEISKNAIKIRDELDGSKIVSQWEEII